MRADTRINEYGRAMVLRSALIKAGGVALFVALTVAASRVKVWLPFSPVPMTLQPMAVLLAGAVLGPWLGALSQAIYLMIGLAGAPVFAGAPGGGPLVLAGPTGGYLMSYPFVAALVGSLARRARGLLAMMAAMAAGLLTIYAFGVLHLMIYTGADWKSALAFGVYPFAVADAIKVCVAAALAHGRRGVARRR